MSISNQELEELCATLAALELSEGQRLLLDKVLTIAWDFVGSHSSLDAQFDGCFEPEEAAAILAYPSPDLPNSITKSITRASGMASSITRAVQP